MHFEASRPWIDCRGIDADDTVMPWPETMGLISVWQPVRPTGSRSIGTNPFGGKDPIP
jgi:hypothetical protein